MEAIAAEADVPTLEANHAEAVHRLSVLTGRPPAALVERLKRPKSIPTPRLPIPTGIPADILLTRPDVRMAERQYAEYTAKIGEAEAARCPSVSLTGTSAPAPSSSAILAGIPPSPGPSARRSACRC